MKHNLSVFMISYQHSALSPAVSDIRSNMAYRHEAQHCHFPFLHLIHVFLKPESDFLNPKSVFSNTGIAISIQCDAHNATSLVQIRQQKFYREKVIVFKYTQFTNITIAVTSLSDVITQYRMVILQKSTQADAHPLVIATIKMIRWNKHNQSKAEHDQNVCLV